MHCKKCGAALPSEGFICKSCGAMMDSNQIKEQKQYLKNEKNNKIEFKSDIYSNSPISRNYENRKENKLLGTILIVLVVILLIIIAIFKVM